MPTVDGVAAAHTLLSFTRVTPGYCLYYVWQAYKAHGATSSATYPTAYSAWQASAYKHAGDYNPPAGVPVYLGPRSGSNAGDVMISLGGGKCAATDWPHNGVTGVCTIAQRMAQTNRPYLGWTEDILGNPIAQVRPTPTPTPDDEEDDDMPRNSGFRYPNSTPPNTVTYLVCNGGSGWYHEFSNGPGAGNADGSYINPVAVAFDTPNWASITESHANAIKRSLDLVRQGK